MDSVQPQFEDQRRALGAAEVGLVVLDREMRVHAWNAWMATASRIETTAALGARLGDLFPDMDLSQIESALNDAIDWGTTSLLSTATGRVLFPLYRTIEKARGAERIEQLAVLKPLAGQDGNRLCLIQISDISGFDGDDELAAVSASRRTPPAQALEALAESYRLSELHNRAIVDNTADAIITFDETGAVSTVNPAAERMFGYRAPEVVGRSIGLLLPEILQDGAGVGSVVERFIGGRREVGAVDRKGRAFTLELSVSVMPLDGRRLYIAIGHDVTERKRAEEELRTQKEWLYSLFNALPDIVCFKDAQGRWLVANELYLETFGLRNMDYRGLTSRDMARLRPDEQALWQAGREADEKAWRQRRTVVYERLIPGPGGKTRHYEIFKVPLFEADGARKGLVVVGRDITERKIAAQHIERLAHHDGLTDLPNRILLQERVRRGIAQSRRTGNTMAFMMLDLDKFKEVNDTLGHHLGDLLLKAVAQRLCAVVRETDTVARLGGDEFAVVLTNLHEVDGAGRVAETIIETIAEPFDLNGIEVRTGTSIGITLYPNDADDADTLLKNADLALYRSKAEGRGTYHFYVEQMNAEVQARKGIENDLRAVMARAGFDPYAEWDGPSSDASSDGPLSMVYQPLIDLRTGLTTGAEALIRWTHEDKGPIPPGEFIPVIERTDLVYPLGRWVLHRVCRQARAWIDQGLPPLTIAVNLSPAQFRNEDLVAAVRRALAESGIAPRSLQLEITEGTAMDNLDSTLDILSTLRSLGCTIAIDDFGTGYSSLGYLRTFPLDKLKVDRTFVDGIGHDATNAAILQAVIQLGHSIGARVNVEGVEYAYQAEFMRRAGVDEAQGYFFSRPLPPDRFANLVRSGTVVVPDSFMPESRVPLSGW